MFHSYNGLFTTSPNEEPMKFLAAVAAALLLSVSGAVSAAPAAQASSYFDNTGRSDVLSGGVRMIPITTPKGTFKVWTKRVGNNPTIKILLLHGGPGATHEYFEAADSYFPGASIEYYYYDQLGSAYSDQPDEPSLWETPRFVEEVEQVRKALGLNKDNFFLLGHSWGGILAAEYALKYGQNLKGLIISNMMMSIPAYNQYADKVLMPKMDQKALREILAMEKAGKYDDPRYEELLVPYYEAHILRMPSNQWPDPVLRAFAHINKKIYVPMQGPSEMGSHNSKLEHWDRVADLPKIAVPTLVIAGKNDTMDPAHMKMVSEKVQHGRLLMTNGGHMDMYDDQKTYFNGLIKFMKDVDSGKFK
jgi:proline iminopeptidase